jgi:methanogenic corrinoid protein MtbC1
MYEREYAAWIELMDQEDKEGAVLYARQLIENGLSPIDLFQSFLTPALSQWTCPVEDKESCIWKEHARTAIVRTILEGAYPAVAEAKKNVVSVGKSVVIACPSEEYHEVGPLIVANYFELAGFHARYIGANTPKDDILSALKILKPDFLALSVTSFYNVVQTRKILEDVRQKHPHIQILIGGTAFLHEGNRKAVPHDYYLTSFADIANLAKEVCR